MYESKNFSKGIFQKEKKNRCFRFSHRCKKKHLNLNRPIGSLYFSILLIFITFFWNHVYMRSNQIKER